ncbi:MAG: hypothetical protein NTV97_02855, partial [Alphaproteobacteria bacterium]|nr:hypothetical protein [Alphaproteobacteria bacterium]
TATDLNIPVEAYAASTSYAIDPSLALGPELWDEVDRANATRVDELNNQFIDRQREILHIGDDAFFKQTGRDAILNAPAIHARLEAARQETLGRTANDVQRQWLDETLGKHKIVEHFDIGDHVGRQSLVWQKSINRRRLDLLNRQAGIDHADPRMIEALANASESSARDHARASGHRPDSPGAQAEVDIARSSVFRHAIEGALAKGAHAVAIKLHERAKEKLVLGDAELLDRIIEDARESEIGRDYVARIAPPSAMTNRSIVDLDKAQAEAIARNSEDWKDNASQRATNQHFINVQFGKAKRQVEMDKAKLARTVRDWLTTPGSDGRLRTARPPIVTWAKLTREEQKGVDSVLKMNARRGKSAEELVRGSDIILAQATLPQMQAEGRKEEKNRGAEEEGARNAARAGWNQEQTADQADRRPQKSETARHSMGAGPTIGNGRLYRSEDRRSGEKRQTLHILGGWARAPRQQDTAAGERERPR